MFKSKKWSEPLNDLNERLIIRKEDGGLVETQVSQQYGDLHSAEGSFKVNRKVPVYKPTRVGRARIQDRMVYFVDGEEQSPMDDEGYIHGQMIECYGHSLADAREKNKNKGQGRDGALSKGGLMSVIWLLLAFVIFLTIWVGGSVTSSSSAGTGQSSESNISGPPPTVAPNILRPTKEVVVDANR